jgi:REP element-mobilizing transposase RayT
MDAKGMKSHNRKSIRLKGFDYSQPAEYFVTICTKDRACILGEIVDGGIRLSETGMIAETCWREIPEHFENTIVDVFQLMPNHVHGIIEIREQFWSTPTHTQPVGVEYIQPLQNHHGGPSRPKQHRYQHVIPKSLGSIIRSFKAAVTREIGRGKEHRLATIWQRDFYDHIIRGDVDHFFVEQYIERNPIMWELDADNPQVRKIPIETFRKILQKEHDLNGLQLEKLIDYEMGYRQWSGM